MEQIITAKLPPIIGDVWINSPPLTTSDFQDKVVLVDFWTYSCVNCRRTLPYLRRWWDMFQDRPFLIIGIHAPEFEFEKNPANVKRAVEELGVAWPVVLDNDHINWRNFSNHYWPAKYLSDKEGNIVYTHFGEGEYANTEKAIQNLLEDDEIGSLDLPLLQNEPPEKVCFIPTPELYCGYERGDLANADGYHPDKIYSYEAPKPLPDDSIALDRQFIVAPEFVQSAGLEATLLVHFRAMEVNLVMAPVDKRAEVRILLNDMTPSENVRGNDVNERGEILIGKPDMYNLLKSDRLIQGTLSITAQHGHFRAYAFTFSGCTG